MSASSGSGPKRAGDSSVRPGGASAVVIQAARASPMASEEENPEPLHPLATHRSGRSGTGPATNRPSGLMVNSPWRTGCQALLRGLGLRLGSWLGLWLGLVDEGQGAGELDAADGDGEHGDDLEGQPGAGPHGLVEERVP